MTRGELVCQLSGELRQVETARSLLIRTSWFDQERLKWDVALTVLGLLTQRRVLESYHLHDTKGDDAATIKPFGNGSNCEAARSVDFSCIC